MVYLTAYKFYATLLLSIYLLISVWLQFLYTMSLMPDRAIQCATKLSFPYIMEKFEPLVNFF